MSQMIRLAAASATESTLHVFDVDGRSHNDYDGQYSFRGTPRFRHFHGEQVEAQVDRKDGIRPKETLLEESYYAEQRRRRSLEHSRRKRVDDVAIKAARSTRSINN